MITTFSQSSQMNHKPTELPITRYAVDLLPGHQTFGHPLDFVRFFPKMGNRRLGVELALSSIGLPFQKIEYYSPDFKHRFVNYHVHKGANPWSTKYVFDAHYDVLRLDVDNFQDNTSSVMQLLFLLSRPEFVGSVVFSDAEEVVSYAVSGARVAAEHILHDRREERPKDLDSSCCECDDLTSEELCPWCDRETYWKLSKPIVACLELTGIGSGIWTTPEAPEIGQNWKYPCPINNSAWYKRTGVESFCVGALPLDHKEAWDTWKVCHQESDTFDKADRDGMLSFNNWLLKLSLSK